MANGEGNTFTRVLAGITFVAVMTCGLLGVASFVLKKVQRETRALLIKNEQGFYVWVDRADAYSGTNSHGYTGFTARFGAMFEVRFIT